MKNKLKFMFFKCVLLFCIYIGFWSCVREPDLSTAPKIGFNEIKSIMSNKCSSCHGVGGELFSIDSARIMRSVVPFKPYSSRLFTVVTNTYSGNFMPPLPNSPLDNTQRTKLYLWILQGADPNSVSSTNPGNSGNPQTVNDSVSFLSEVLPIYVSNCTSSTIGNCHDALFHVEGYDLTTYVGIRRGITPYNSAASRVYTVMSSSGENQMPPGLPPVSSTQKATILKWINEGAKNTNFTSSCDTTKFKFTDINVIIQASCVGCHNSSSAGGGIQLTSYPLVKFIADNGRLIAVITSNTMPKYNPLIDCKKIQIRKWVNAGSLQY